MFPHINEGEQHSSISWRMFITSYLYGLKIPKWIETKMYLLQWHANLPTTWIFQPTMSPGIYSGHIRKSLFSTFYTYFRKLTLNRSWTAGAISSVCIPPKISNFITPSPWCIVKLSPSGLQPWKLIVQFSLLESCSVHALAKATSKTNPPCRK